MVLILLLIAIAGLLLVGGLLVQIPLLFSGQAFVSATASLVFSLSWGPVFLCHKGSKNGETAVGITGRTLYQKAGKFTPSDKEEIKADESEGEERDQKKSATDILTLLHGISEPLLTIFRAISFDHWFCVFRCGTGDPATTGELYGYVQALRGVLTPCPDINLQMTPEFNEVVLEGETELAFRIDHPFLLLPQVIHITRYAIHSTRQVKNT